MYAINEFNNSNVGQQQHVIRKNLPMLASCAIMFSVVITLVIRAI